MKHPCKFMVWSRYNPLSEHYLSLSSNISFPQNKALFRVGVIVQYSTEISMILFQIVHPSIPFTIGYQRFYNI